MNRLDCTMSCVVLRGIQEGTLGFGFAAFKYDVWKCEISVHHATVNCAMIVRNIEHCDPEGLNHMS